MLEAIEAFTGSRFFPLLVGAVACYGLTQIVKRIYKAAGVRHEPIVERTLPLVPPFLGVVLFAAMPHELGVDVLVRNGHHSIHVAGAVFGAVLGLFSAGIYSAITAAFPSVAKRLEHADTGGPDKPDED